jgi:hypothetical protein
VPREKPKLSIAAQALLVQWIDAALGPNKRGDFVHHFKIKGFKQGTFNRDIGAAGRFPEERARVVCKAIGRSFEALAAGTLSPMLKSDCDYRCDLFHGINGGTCTDANQVAARRLATLRVIGRFKIVYRFVSGVDQDYEVEFKPCSCGAVHFEYVKDDDPLPLCHLGFALCVGDMLSIYMIGEGLHWTMACHVPQQVNRRPLTGIILDPNAKRSQIEANKFVLFKLGTPVADAMTAKKIAGLLNNLPDATNGALIAARE